MVALLVSRLQTDSSPACSNCIWERAQLIAAGLKKAAGSDVTMTTTSLPMGPGQLVILKSGSWFGKEQL